MEYVKLFGLDRVCLIRKNEVQDIINKHKKMIRPEYENCQPDHYVFCSKIYDKDDNLVEVHLYAQPLDKIQFEQRTSAEIHKRKIQNRSVWFGCWHKYE